MPEETRGGEDGVLAEQAGGSSLAEGNTDGDRTLENSQVLTDHDTSPKRTSLKVCSSLPNDELIDSATNETSPAQKSSNASNKGATSWQTVATAPSNNNPIKKSLSPVFNGFGLFTNIDQQTDDTIAISAAFLK